MSKAVQTAVMGVTGYAGAELARLLVRHPRLKGATPVFLGRAEASRDAKVPTLGEIHPHLHDSHGTGNLPVEPFSFELMEDLGVEVLFLATPHELSRELVPQARKRGIRVIDLSGAWRLEAGENRAVYRFEDEGSADALQMQAEAVYGMPELHRAAIHGAGLVANPGVLCDERYLGAEAAGAGRPGGSGARDYCGCQKRRERRGESTDGEDALHVRGG